MNSPLDLTLHGQKLRLESEHAAFLNYARAYLSALVPTSDSAAERPAVHTRLLWDEQPAERWGGAQVLQHGRRLFQQNGWILESEVLHLPGLQRASTWSPEQAQQLQVAGYYRPAGRLLRWAVRFPGLLSSIVQRIYAILCYDLVLFPLIHSLAQTRGWRLLHAAALSLPQGDVLLAGLPGSGKTTFALAFLAQPQARLLSENLVLVGPQGVFAVPEPLHLSAASRHLLPPVALDRLHFTGRRFSYNRSDYDLQSTARRWGAQPQAVFLLGLSGQPSIRALPPEQAQTLLQAGNRLAKEVQAYEQYAAALAGIAPQVQSAAGDPLATLLERVPAYHLVLGRGAPLEPAMQQVFSVLDSSSLSVASRSVRHIQEVPSD